jgi:hypothetical protein
MAFDGTQFYEGNLEFSAASSSGTIFSEEPLEGAFEDRWGYLCRNTI